MRKLTIAQFSTLDGVVEAPERWHFPYVDAEFHRAMWSGTDEIDTMLLGRVTYEVFAGAFAAAPADDPVAAQLNRPAKAVVSASLRDPVWANTTVLDGNAVEQVRELKAKPGGGILTVGSITLSRTLLAAGLVDELHLMIHPIVVGTGERLFPAEGPNLPLTLAGIETLSSSVLSVRYATA